MIGGQRNWGCRLAGGSLGRVGSTWAIVESRASPMGRERTQWIEMALLRELCCTRYGGFISFLSGTSLWFLAANYYL